jgi:hypothetical protein
VKLFSISHIRATHTSLNAHVFASSSPFSRKKRLAVVSTVLLLGAALASGQVTANTPNSGPQSATAAARARAAFLKYMSSHRPMVRSIAPHLDASAGAKSSPSVNWSGYADIESASNTVTSVSGEWVIPAVHCPSGPYRYQDAFLAQWVGIDGATNGTVEQLGSGTQCFEGVTYYYVWYEMFPAGTVVEGTTACINDNVDCPQPGDYITASVTVTPGAGTNNYALTLNDVTRPQESFSVTATCGATTCLDASAEWIVERPAFDLPFGFQILPLSDFSVTGFFDGKLTSGGKTTNIENFHDGGVYEVPMSDDSGSYWLDCIGQTQPGPALLQTDNFSSCPTVTPSSGSFNVTWDSSF